MSFKRFKVAIIGCGAIARARHIPIWRRQSDVTLVAVCDSDAQKAKWVSQTYKVERWFTNYLDLLESCKPDIVDICTPTGLHAEQAIEALKTGSNVLVEKPLARTTAQAEAVRTAAAKSGAIITVCHTWKFIDAFAQATQLISDSYGNEPIMYIGHTAYRPEDFPQWVHSRDHGGFLYELGAHHTYLILDLVQEVDNLTTLNFDEKMIYCLMEGTKGLGCFTLIATKNAGSVSIELYMPSLKVWIQPTVGIKTVAKHELRDYFSEPIKRVVGLSKLRTWLVKREMATPHAKLINAFIDAIKRGEGSPVTIKEGIETVRLLEALERKLYDGKRG